MLTLPPDSCDSGDRWAPPGLGVEPFGASVYALGSNMVLIGWLLRCLDTGGGGADGNCGGDSMCGGCGEGRENDGAEGGLLGGGGGGADDGEACPAARMAA